MIFEVAHQMGLLPLVWLLGLSLCGIGRGVEWWWLASAFGISWVADSLSHVVSHQVVGLVYPMSQAALVAAVFRSRREAQRFLMVLVIVGFVAILFHEPGPGIMLRTVAWLGVVGLVWPARGVGRLRTALVTAFGGGWLAWTAYLVAPGWTSWGVYQGVRAVSLGLFCWAAWAPRPLLRVA